jgi:uncharacterized protein YkwD
MAFGDEKLDVYRAAIESVGWAYRYCETLKGHRNAKDQRLRASQAMALAGCIMASIVAGTTLAAVDGPGANQGTGDAREPSLALDQVASQIMGLTNDLRRGKGEPPLTTNERLVDTARDFAAFMARTGRYGHQADGKTPGERARAHGYDFCLIAENIGYQLGPGGIETEELAQVFLRGWKESSGHRANLLDSAAREIGVAVARSRETGRVYAVQMFGRPRSMQTEININNVADVGIEYELGDRRFSLPPRYRRTHQICRTPVLRVHWPNGEGSVSVEPDDGARLRIERGPDGKLRLRNE